MVPRIVGGLRTSGLREVDRDKCELGMLEAGKHEWNCATFVTEVVGKDKSGNLRSNSDKRAQE